MFLFTIQNRILAEKEIEETIPFITAWKRIKYLGINLSEDIKDIYSENWNCKTLMKEIKDVTIIGKKSHTSG